MSACDAKDGDIFFNPIFGDLWLVINSQLVKINDGYTIELDKPEDFELVGHIDLNDLRLK